MRLLLTMSAAVAIGAAALLTGPPAAAQVGVEVGPGVGVRIGEPDRRYEERRRVRVYEDRTVGECRTVTVRKERDDGTVVTRRERRCD